MPGVPPFLPLICYEAIFPQGLRAPEGRPEWLLQITNDAWFGEASGPYQHFAQARVRAIEQGLPLARAANTGISAMVDPYGRVVAALDLGEMGVVDATLPSRLPPTPYTLLGDLFALIAISSILVLTLINLYHGNPCALRDNLLREVLWGQGGSAAAGAPAARGRGRGGALGCISVKMSASDIDVHVGTQMRKRREALGISQGRLGRHLGLTFSQIQKYEKGTNRVGAGRLYQIATSSASRRATSSSASTAATAATASSARTLRLDEIRDAQRRLRLDQGRRDPRLGARPGPLARRRREPPPLGLGPERGRAGSLGLIERFPPLPGRLPRRGR